MEVRSLRAPGYCLIALYLILPLLLLHIQASVLGSLDHRQFNLEFLLLGAFCVFLPRSLGFVLLFSEFLADCVYQICIVYQTWPDRLLTLQRYTRFLPTSRILAGAGLLFLGLLVCATLVLIRPRQDERLCTSIGLLACLLALLSVDVITGHNLLFLRRDSASLPRIVRTPVLSLGFRQQLYHNLLKQAAHGDDLPMPSASLQLLPILNRPDGSPTHVNVVLIMVESWGLSHDPQMARALTAPYQDPSIRTAYTVEQGTIPFMGATMAGEARELCHSGMALSILHISGSRAGGCLPDKLRERGYRTVSFHGFSGAMYFRDELYPKLGFDKSWFMEDLTKAGLPRCGGPFPGVCDAAVAQFMSARLAAAPQTQPQFFYWVSLNSHLPVPLKTDIPDDGSCLKQPSLRASANLCSWFRLVRQVHESVAQMAIQSVSRPTVFLLVGDHAPPFRDAALRESFDPSDVPYVLLVPTALGEGSRPRPKNALRRTGASKPVSGLGATYRKGRAKQ